MELRDLRRNIIYCPNCARELYEPGTKQTMKVTIRCGCGFFYEIDPVRKQAIRVDRPERRTSSGDRFY